MPDELRPPAVEGLLRLQDAEITIRQLERRLEDLPEQADLDVVRHEAAALKAEQDAHRVDRDLLDSQIRRLEGELSVLQQRRDAERSRLYGGGIANPRELQALRADLDHVTGRIEHLEDELLDVMERREALTGTIDELEERRQALAPRAEELTKARDEAAKDVLAELAEARVRRDAERGAVPDDLMRRYEASKSRHGEVGVGRLEGTMCSACRLELTPLEISELRSGPPVGTCPQCQRLLVAID
ncbi:MAG: C4-type zinc ribbon domain-containing protein [Actinomycetota bacterium]|nr:C4-type zinc ribbon domain-containing protein [Actinomycetota bacterium]